ncbi:hypothetical protein T484DRAFT_1851573, partial [Baffinella frigidus]
MNRQSGKRAKRHRSTIRAHTDGTLFVLDREEFQQLCKHFPEVERELQKATNSMISIAKHT